MAGGTEGNRSGIEILTDVVADLQKDRVEVLQLKASRKELLEELEKINQCFKCRYGYRQQALTCPGEADAELPCAGFENCYSGNVAIETVIRERGKRMSKYTKGEWKTSWPSKGYHTIFQKEFGQICSITAQCADDESQCEANANLIAAAPNLLTACQQFVNDGRAHLSVIDQGIMAITKATKG